MLTLSVVIFLVVYVLIAFEVIDKTAAALAGASAVILLHAVPYEVALHSVDMNVLFLLIGMMIVMSILSETGFLEWLAIAIAQRAKGNARVIVLQFLFVTAFTSAFLDNVTTVILIAPITILITQLLGAPTAPVLILMAIFSNIGGTATLIGDPPNIIIGSGSGLTFNEFLVNLSPPVIIMTIVSLAVINFRFGPKLITSVEARRRVMLAEARLAILDHSLLRKSGSVLAIILLGFFTSRLTGFEPGIVALGGAVLMIIVCRIDIHTALHKVEWATILFFIGLFMLISALEHNQLFEILGDKLVHATQGNLLLTVMVILWVSAFASAIVDNIPLVIAMMPLIKIMIPAFALQMGIADDPAAIHTTVEAPLYWALALGACLGGNGTLIGASANVVIAQIANRNNAPITFMAFTKEGFPLMILTVAIAAVYMYFRYF
ncbi:MAG: ArsB/NhaD family transporter [Candidatus Hydrogenedentes bacterium]|nr:ArsB/NhaD family transporter [Candidatus Hydrogenedentota bacterium]